MEERILYKDRDSESICKLFSSEITDLYLNGASIQEIMFLFDTDFDTVSEFVKDIKSTDINKSLHNKISLMKRRGLSISEIASILEIDEEIVKTYDFSKKRNKHSTKNVNYFMDTLNCLRTIRDLTLYPRPYDMHVYIKSLVEKGLNGVEIGEVLGITKQSVSKYMNLKLGESKN